MDLPLSPNATQSLLDIKNQIAALEQRANEIRSAEYASVIADIREKIALYGISMAQIGFGDGSAKTPRAEKGITKKVEAKYRDSNGNTWSGRGLKPKWLAAAIEAGQPIESFLVNAGEQVG